MARTSPEGIPPAPPVRKHARRTQPLVDNGPYREHTRVAYNLRIASLIDSVAIDPIEPRLRCGRARWARVSSATPFPRRLADDGTHAAHSALARIAPRCASGAGASGETRRRTRFVSSVVERGGGCDVMRIHLGRAGSRGVGGIGWTSDAGAHAQVRLCAHAVRRARGRTRRRLRWAASAAHRRRGAARWRGARRRWRICEAGTFCSGGGESPARDLLSRSSSSDAHARHHVHGVPQDGFVSRVGGAAHGVGGAAYGAGGALPS